MRALRSVRGRVTATATAVVALTLLIASMLVVALVERDLRAEAEAAVRSALTEQASQVDGASGFALLGGGETFQFGVFEEAGELAFGKLFVDDELTAEVEVNLTSGRVNELLDPATGSTLDDPGLLAELEELTFIFLNVDGETGTRLLAGATSQADLDISTSAVRRALLLTVPLVLMAFAALTWWLVGRALKPVDAITNRVGDISTANLEERVPVPDSGDEVARLATVMNEMLGRLERGDERQRRFAADASHELRTPLATIRAAAEIIENAPSPSARASLAGDIATEIERMDALIGDLLALAREDARAELPEAEIDLVELACEVAAAAGVDFRADGECLVSGDPAQLARMLRNLLENARRHARSNVRLLVVRIDASLARLTVEDDGPGVALGDRETVFERFARLDDGRARDGGGSGLGLALVKSIVQRHGGTVTVDESTELGGARFTVVLPLRQ